MSLHVVLAEDDPDIRLVARLALKKAGYRVTAVTNGRELLEVGRLKDEFVSTVSHELRTPLTSIKGSLQLVLADPDSVPDTEYHELLTVALTNTERLVRLINDTLDISKIDAGRLILIRTPGAPAELVRQSPATAPISCAFP